MRDPLDDGQPRNLSSYPPSVKPGIPRLTPTPKGWTCAPLGTHLHEIKRPVILEKDREYTLVTVRRSRGGIDKREVLRGKDIKTPTQFFVKHGDFLISKRQIVHGACGVVPQELDNAIVSNEYAVLGTDGNIDLQFLKHLSETTYFQQTCFHSSVGVHVEKMVFKTERWLSWPFNIPPKSKQLEINKLLAVWERAVSVEQELVANSDRLVKALTQKLLPRAHTSLPKGWSVVHLGDLVEINPRRPTRPTDGRVSFIPMDAVSEEGLLLRSEERSYDSVASGHPAFRDGDVLVAKITPCFENGKGAVVNGLKNGIGFGSTEFFVLRPKVGIPSELIARVTSSSEFRRRGATEMVGSAGQKRLSQDFIRTFRFACPDSEPERMKIAAALGTVASIRSGQAAILNVLKRQLRLLTNNLATGRVWG